MSAESVASTSRSVAPGSMIRRKVDDRLKLLIEDVAQQKHRGLILLIGDRGKDQIVNLHLMISRANHNAKVNVLWCMKKEPDFGSTSKKRQERRARLEVKGGMATEATKEAFQTFLAQTQIRFCKYSETHKILGQTFGMAVLQDFEAMNPNTLARTMETVKGGGLIVIMFRAMRSLRQLYTIAMDVHARYRTESQQDVVPRFNERFLLSLTDCDTALCVDDDLTVLPITSKMKHYGKRGPAKDYDAELVTKGELRHEAELTTLKDRLRPSAAVGPLVQVCQTMDQAKTVLSLMQTVAEKKLDTTCVVTAGRGRGKSAALGMAAAGAIAQGYSNIFCSAPSPENLQTFFEFAVRGLKELGYKEKVEFEALESTSEEFSKCIIRISVFREHRQTIQFVSATDAAKFAQAELAIIDEAAALPLPLVKQMLGPYLVFLSSTVSGYEGTGRSLSMKLVADMRRRSGGPDQRQLKEVALQDPIRYGPNDPVERWLNKLLCLDTTLAEVSSSPHPNTCELYYVNRDALFSYHPLAEALLQRLQSLLIAAHYKNQPNDLQLLSDAPGHHLFILCADKVTDGAVPDIYCVVHACEEGRIQSETITKNMSLGLRPSGDLIPYTLSQYYLEEGFAQLSGLRVVRIATNPALQRAGYGSRALALLHQYYTGAVSLTPAQRQRGGDRAAQAPGTGEEADVREEDPTLRPRQHIPNLLTALVERPYEPLDYLGVSFGLTTELFNFWKRAGYEMLYLRQAINELTCEHSCVMVRSLGFDLRLLQREFHRRLLPLLSMPFRTLPAELALSVVADLDVHHEATLRALTDTQDAGRLEVRVAGVTQTDRAALDQLFSSFDLKRLSLYSTSFLEGGNVLDLLPKIATLYFGHGLYKLPDGTDGVVLSHAQAAVLLAVGLQCRTVEELAAQAAFKGVTPQQLRAYLQKAIARISEHFRALEKLSGGAAGRDAGGVAADAEGPAERVTETKDRHGNVVGLVVEKRVRREVNTNTHLLHSASQAVTGDDKSAKEDLQDVFRRPKKKSKRAD
ncbi:N-acetyltransferase 10 [Strigomonas culicis]|uniref:RNA cytidine acetyltransferase n=1 Tax=Strigomonas culicis TaxID=28005 RepID=S9TXA1_9TRYP|nr:N-acetyltransferase 10 [Strigomonas culicis]|eukprot:EPY21209.1 N-acetyltransferase 10 [Strigomonas culicis]